MYIWKSKLSFLKFAIWLSKSLLLSVSLFLSVYLSICLSFSFSFSLSPPIFSPPLSLSLYLSIDLYEYIFLFTYISLSLLFLYLSLPLSLLISLITKMNHYYKITPKSICIIYQARVDFKVYAYYAWELSQEISEVYLTKQPNLRFTILVIDISTTHSEINL